jgi:hypothetical protein
MNHGTSSLAFGGGSDVTLLQHAISDRQSASDNGRAANGLTFLND